MPKSLTGNSKTLGALLRVGLVGVNLALTLSMGLVLWNLFWPGAFDDPIPAVNPVRLALASESSAPVDGGLAREIGAQLDVPLPEPEPLLEAAPALPSTSPLAGWDVVALLQRDGQPSTAILSSGGRQITVQAGDAFGSGKVHAIHLDPQSGSVRVEVAHNDQLAKLEHQFLSE